MLFPEPSLLFGLWFSSSAKCLSLYVAWVGTVCFVDDQTYESATPFFQEERERIACRKLVGGKGVLGGLQEGEPLLGDGSFLILVVVVRNNKTVTHSCDALVGLAINNVAHREAVIAQVGDIGSDGEGIGIG